MKVSPAGDWHIRAPGQAVAKELKRVSLGAALGESTLKAAVVLVALLLPACSGGDLLTFEESKSKLSQHQQAYEWLARDLRACGLSHLKATGQALDQCKGTRGRRDLQSAMMTLGIKEASLSGDRVDLMTGADSIYGQSMAVAVGSYMIHVEDPDPSLTEPLTEAPHHWFYSTHD